jgi:phosphatidylinositol dimannoside acyltransferase
VTPWWRRFLTRGVFWRKALRFGAINAPVPLESVFVGTWALVFLLWSAGRHGVMRNLAAIKPGSSPIANFFRAYRVFWNFAWTITDNGRFLESRVIPDWEFVGLEYFDQLVAQSAGAIILTAHMGSYDLGAHLFSETSGRRMVMVRAPESDAQTHDFEERNLGRGSGGLRIDFNTRSNELAIELLHAIQEGQIVAIQGDRVTPGISSMPATLFGQAIELPSGPFALAMASRVPIFPLFIMRQGRRSYRLLTCRPIQVERRTRNRDEDLRQAMNEWATTLEQVIAEGWHQWATFEPFMETPRR